MLTTPFEPQISLEITIAEPLFRQLQQALDTHRRENLDDLTSKALTAYLLHLNTQGDYQS